MFNITTRVITPESIWIFVLECALVPSFFTGQSQKEILVFFATPLPPADRSFSCALQQEHRHLCARIPKDAFTSVCAGWMISVFLPALSVPPSFNADSSQIHADSSFTSTIRLSRGFPFELKVSGDKQHSQAQETQKDSWMRYLSVNWVYFWMQSHMSLSLRKVIRLYQQINSLSSCYEPKQVTPYIQQPKKWIQ